MGYGTLGLLLELLAHALPLFSPIGAPVDPKLTAKSIYYRNASLYSVDSFFELFASLGKFWFAIVGLQFYSIRLSQYGGVYDLNASSKYFDFLFLCSLLWTIPIYLYRIIFAVLNV